MKLNRGEWAEPYVALRLLGDGRLYISDEEGFRRENEWMEVLEVIRRETTQRIVSYGRSSDDYMVVVSVNGDECVRLPASSFTSAANNLLRDINSGKGRTFSASEEVMDFLSVAEVISLKAKSIDKNDLYLTTLDPRSGIVRHEIGFSVKSKFGNNPTLFNTAVASGVRYRVDGMTPALMESVNSIMDEKGHASVASRCEALLDNGCKLEYDGYAYAKRAQCEAFKENLDLINPRLPLVLERLLWNHFFTSQTSTDIVDVVDDLIRQNPLRIQRPEVKYPQMIKSFLYAAYCGMTASTLWDGRAEVNGGFITVDENGGVLAHYALDSESFKGYLYNNCYLEFPSTSPKHGDYGYVYKHDGTYYFKLNFQIRYR